MSEEVISPQSDPDMAYSPREARRALIQSFGVGPVVEQQVKVPYEVYAIASGKIVSRNKRMREAVEYCKHHGRDRYAARRQTS